MAKQPHLTELFSQGKAVSIIAVDKAGQELEIDLWVKKPDPAEHDECVKKARVYKARRLQELRDKDSDERLALEQEITAMDKEELIEAHMESKLRDLDRRAIQDVTFSEETEKGSGVTKYGKYWGPNGEQWIDLLEAISARLTEIRDHNTEVAASGVDSEGLEIDPMEDEELGRLNAVQEEFSEQVTERRDQLVEDVKRELAVKTRDRLIKELLEHRISLEVDSVWFTHFKYWQLLYAVRYQDDGHPQYFKSVEQIRALPKTIQDQLWRALDDVELDVTDLKNSLTPLNS